MQLHRNVFNIWIPSLPSANLFLSSHSEKYITLLSGVTAALATTKMKPKVIAGKDFDSSKIKKRSQQRTELQTTLKRRKPLIKTPRVQPITMFGG